MRDVDTPPSISQATSQVGPARTRGPGWIGAFAVGGALCSALVTFLVLAGLTPILPTHAVVVWVLFTNVILVVVLLGIVTWESWGLVRARLAGAAGSGLHVRVVGLFSLVAALPAILVAIVASFTLNRGLDPWFAGSLRALMSNTVEIAEAYRDSQCRTLARETQLMASDLNRARVLFDADRKLFTDFMQSRASFLGFPVAMIVDRDGTVVERAEGRAGSDIPAPAPDDLKDASDKEATCLVPREGNVFRSTLKLAAHDGWTLFVARPVDPRAIEFPAVAQAGIEYYMALEQKRVGIQVAFASMFALIALIVLLSAIWFGLSFATRLVAPIRRLINATDQVASGNFYVQVPYRRNEGDLAHLGETFNKMTAELRNQHDGLTAASDLIDRRRRFMEAVLSGVSAGVIGIDAHGLITIVNPSSEALLRVNRGEIVGKPVIAVLPEIAQLIDEAKTGRPRLVQQQVPISREGRDRTLNIRVTSEQARGEDKGFIVTLDDITDLVTAQRTSAWADVARRIAHEIKNPLTPIQLSAERIRRKYGRHITQDREIFEQCTDTIVRQVDDIKRMVDEFSSFARMPKPAIAAEDLIDTVRQIVFMMRIAHPDVTITDHLPATPLVVRFDRRLLSQAVQNIMKNAAEAIAAIPDDSNRPAAIDVSVVRSGDDVRIDIADTGKGFPKEGRQRLLEPYMTTRDGGTGLGLAIVGKILEDHGGAIELLDNPAGRGGLVRLNFPIAADGPAQPRPTIQPERQREDRMSTDILIVDDEADIRELVAGILQDEGHSTRTAGSSDEALAAVAARRPHLVFLDIWLQGSRLDGLQVLELIKADHPDLPVVMISGHGNIETAVSAIKAGAYDFIEKPFKADRLVLVADRSLEAWRLRREVRDLRSQSVQASRIAGRSTPVNQLRQAIERAAPTNARILVAGAPGSGKELASRTLHAQSGRSSGPFVVINAATITPDNMEAELFGVEANGERSRRIGAMEEAHGGTLYIDEIADMSREVQGRILRVLVDQNFQRVGGSTRVHVDVRIISSSSRDLPTEIAAGRMREDLFHRLSVIPIRVPALAERREDVPELIEFFQEQISASTGLPKRRIGDQAMAVLQSHDWPGNVRQLRNNVERLMILTAGDADQEVTAEMLPSEIGTLVPSTPNGAGGERLMSLPLREAREIFEREYLVAQITRFSGNISRTAEFIGMERSALHRKLKLLGIGS